VIEVVPAAEKAAAKKGVKYKERQAHKASFKA
jgi:large subunit ribosomal protein L15